ncbi:Formate/nitrite transporter-domain-containing protein [Paraphoma chrysanthemicola]|uniref:Formate/nitrite transporter-domain-containing protein n=1 Tax=Paraphoma chrysanthemicola TaxID=798071 RepID=A0A8K0R9T9_9PLEO|nr:Formate/nitrite transporter-domain-containing protein [Paraphoma chrysanthemicola]
MTANSLHTGHLAGHFQRKRKAYKPHVDSMPKAAPTDMLSGLALENAILFNATRKIADPPDKVLFLGILGGIWVGIGGIAGISGAGGVPDAVRVQWVSLPRVILGGWFVFALHFITMFGGELFTGNLMILGLGLMNKKVPFWIGIRHTILVYIGNWAGTLFVGYFFVYLTDLLGTPQYRSYLNEIVVSKLEGPNWGQLFLRAIPANMMVCMAIVLSVASRSATGKMIALWFPVVMFVLSGYEHCVADMIFLGVGLMYGAPSTIGRLWYCQSAAVCGNLIGGALFIGMVAHLANHWKSPVFATREPGTGLAHDVESTRHYEEKDETTSPPSISNSCTCDVRAAAPACEPNSPRRGMAEADNTVRPTQQAVNGRFVHHASMFRSMRPGDDIV